jgi:outer membrane receptor protein involved in Fe transport
MKNDLVPFRFRAAGALFALVLPLTMAGQSPAPAAAPKAPDEPIALSPFVVNADADSGYKAGNSVSATRVQVAIKDLPFMMNAYTEEFIRDLNTQDLSDVLRFSPNVGNASNDFGNGDLRFNLRGFSINVVQRNGLQGLRNVSLNNVSRVEVVKGPASVLYGQVAPGGIVNFITKKPLEKPFQEVRVTVGNESRTQTELDLTGPISKKDGLFYRLNGVYMDGKRSLTPYHNTRYSVAPSLLWNLFGKKDVTISLDYERYYSYEDPPAWARPNTPVWGYEVDNAGNLSYSSFATGPAPSKQMNAPFNYELPENFNQVSNTDFRRVRIENAVAELNAKLPFEINMRAAASFYSYDTIYLVSGIAAIYGGAAFTTAPNVAADPRNATNAPILTSTILRTNPNGSIVYAPVRLADNSIAQVSDSLMQRRMSSEHLLGTTRRSQVDFFRTFQFDWAKFHLVGGLDWLDAWAMYRNARIRDALWTNITWNLRDPSTWNRTNQWSNNEVLALANAQLIQPVPATSNAVYQGGQTEGKGSPTRGSYRIGNHAPFRREPDQVVWQAHHHVLLAHGQAVRAVREHGGRGASVGFVHNPETPVPLDESPENVTAARNYYEFITGHYLWPIFRGAYLPAWLRSVGKNKMKIGAGDMELISLPTDFLGLNQYGGNVIRASRRAPGWEHLPYPKDFPRGGFTWLGDMPAVLYWCPRFA